MAESYTLIASSYFLLLYNRFPFFTSAAVDANNGLEAKINARIMTNEALRIFSFMLPFFSPKITARSVKKGLLCLKISDNAPDNASSFLFQCRVFPILKCFYHTITLSRNRSARRGHNFRR